MAWYSRFFKGSKSEGETLAALPAPAAPRDPIVSGSSKIKSRAKGWSGIPIYSGRVSGVERNPDLSDPRQWAITASAMLTEDDAVGTAWEHVSSTLRSARWVWEPGDETSAFARQLAEDANSLFGFAGFAGRLDQSWEDAVEQMVLYWPIGYRYGEIEWIARGDRIDIARPWVDRDPLAHDRWVLDEHGEWVGVQQSYPMGDGTRGIGCQPVIPADELVYLVRGQRGANMSGIGALRPLYRRWKEKRDLTDYAMEAAERWAVPVPKLTLARLKAEELGSDDHALIQQQVEQVRQSLDNLLKGDARRIEDTDLISVSEYGGTLDPSAIQSMIAACNQSLMLGMLSQHLLLGGIDSSGNRAVAEVHANTFRRSMINILDKIAAAYSGAPRPGGGVIGRWASYNHGYVNPSLLPRLKHSGLDVDPLVDLLTRAPHLAASEWLRPEMADRNALRRRVGLDPEVIEGDDI